MRVAPLCQERLITQSISELHKQTGLGTQLDSNELDSNEERPDVDLLVSNLGAIVQCLRLVHDHKLARSVL